MRLRLLKPALMLWLALAVALTAVPVLAGCPMKHCPDAADCMTMGCATCDVAPAIAASGPVLRYAPVRALPAWPMAALAEFYPQPQSPPPRVAG